MYVHAHTHTHTHSTHTCMCFWVMYVCACECLFVCMCVYLCWDTGVHVCTCRQLHHQAMMPFSHIIFLLGWSCQYLHFVQCLPALTFKILYVQVAMYVCSQLTTYFTCIYIIILTELQHVGPWSLLLALVKDSTIVHVSFQQ